MDDQLTLYTWGYWGWGNVAKQFVVAADAVEKQRRYEPPVFIDIRYHRGVRAQGFRDSSFEGTVGKSRYRWMKSLGNRKVTSGKGIQIDDPESAEDLLDFALQEAKGNRRVIFFCACEYPGTTKDIMCHRTIVASLILEIAKKRRLGIKVIEWPGEEGKEQMTIQVNDETFDSIFQGRKFMPLGHEIDLSHLAAIAILEIVNVVTAQETVDVASGPVRFQKQWVLPIHGFATNPKELNQMKKDVHNLRRRVGVLPRYSL